MPWDTRTNRTKTACLQPHYTLGRGIKIARTFVFFLSVMASFDVGAMFCHSTYTLGTALNDTSSTHPLTTGVHDSKHACVIIDSGNFEHML